MSFDRDKNIWVRQKNPSRQHQLQAEEPSAMNASEDDPFGNIPDLTVEDTTELDTRTGSPVRLQPTAETILEDTEKPDDDEDSRPVTREGKGVAYTETSSAPSTLLQVCNVREYETLLSRSLSARIQHANLNPKMLRSNAANNGDPPVLSRCQIRSNQLGDRQTVPVPCRMDDPVVCPSSTEMVTCRFWMMPRRRIIGWSYR